MKVEHVTLRGFPGTHTYISTQSCCCGEGDVGTKIVESCNARYALPANHPVQTRYMIKVVMVDGLRVSVHGTTTRPVCCVYDHDA